MTHPVVRSSAAQTYPSSMTSCPGSSTTIYRLLTNLLDPAMAPAQELARLYAERREIELCYGELKTVQCQLRPLRSKTAEGVRRELWAHCILYQVSRQLAYQAAMGTADRDCDRISFSAVQDALRRSARLATGLTLRRLTYHRRPPGRERADQGPGAAHPSRSRLSPRRSLQTAQVPQPSPLFRPHRHLAATTTRGPRLCLKLP